MTQPHILLLGAHGNIGKMMIPRFLERSWSVTALIRDSSREGDIKEAGDKAKSANNPGKLDTLVYSLSDVKTSKDAEEVIKKASTTTPVNWIVWTAGAGGKGGLDATIGIDARAAIAFADAATHNNKIERYLTISAINARHSVASWWSDEEKKLMPQAGQSKGMKVYTEAKTVADHCLTTWGEERRAQDKNFKYVVLRPGALVNEYDPEEPYPKDVHLGKATGGKKVLREDVAETAVQLLEKGASGWFDLLQAAKVDGKKQGGPVEQEVQRVIDSNETSVEGESSDDMRKSTAEWPERLEKCKAEVEAMK